ncbi:MAG: hypothetical protein CVT49_10670 [candidate division Zixibacteria bacterium HGW-Zixibacteria-1]|nr:MAG: hypothetical protein CVT49_10670 [candidate division Zixibacteria bacterium HGW-Zixibacteria-1]
MKKDFLVYAGVLILTLFFYFVIPKPVVFSTAVSYIIIVLIALFLLFILVRTIQGKVYERRVVFLFVGIAVVLPFFMSIQQKIELSPEVKALYDTVMDLKPGSKVLVSLDYDPPSAPELQPMAESFFGLCFKRDLKVIIMGLWPQGPQQAELAIQKIMESPDIQALNLQYGRDYVNLGFQTGNEFVIQRMGGSFKSMFQSDYYGTPYDSLELVKNISNFSNIDFSFNLSAGYPGTIEWVQIGVDRFGVKLGAGNTAVQAPQVYPYIRSGQLVGLLGGLNGAAEFEKVTGVLGKGTKFMVSQSFAHVIVIAFIIIGNAAFFLGEKRSRK